MTCAQCQQPESVVFCYVANGEPQRVPLCDEHAAQWWATYKHTGAGQGLAIEAAA